MAGTETILCECQKLCRREEGFVATYRQIQFAVVLFTFELRDCA